eukprot:766258-Hanusia_phi.AAC.3
MEDEDYEFDYEDSDQEQDDGQVDMENEYYTAKGHLQDGKLQSALEGFQKVLDMQSDSKGEWGFKALKQMVKALFRQSRYDEMMKRYKELLVYLHVVTKNQSEKVKRGCFFPYEEGEGTIKILKELHRSCTTDAGQDDQKKGTQLLELYSLEIQMHTEKKDNKKLRSTYEQAMKVCAAVCCGVLRILTSDALRSRARFPTH